MGDTLDDPPGNAREPRRDKPQTLAGIQPTQNLSSDNCSNLMQNSSDSFTHNSAIISSTCSSSYSSSSQHTVHSSSTHSYNETVTSSSATVASGDEATSTRAARSRARASASSGSDERENSCDNSAGRSGVRAASGSGGGCNDADLVDGNSRRESLNYDDSSPSGSNFGKSMFGRPSRYPSSGGATTRKCVLTLDGYSYVIVASTPENRPTRDDSAGSCGIGGSSGLTTSVGNLNERRTSSAASSVATGGSAVNERCNSPTTGNSSGVGGFAAASGGNGSNNVAATSAGSASNFTHSQAINGQVARHGSLTIVRRSNSRKSFAQIETQQTILSPSAAATNSLGATGPFDTPTTPLNDATVATAIASATTAAEATTAAPTSDNRSKDYSASSYLADREKTPLVHSTTFSSNTTSTCNNSSLAASAAAKEQHLHYTSRMQTGASAATSTNTTTTNSNNSSSNNTNNVASVAAVDRMSPTTNTEGTPTASAKGAGDGDVDLNAPGTDNAPLTPISLASCPVDLATENLPAVDTPDACDKAAVRLRCLLRLLSTGEISSDVLQKNLHYAARVLEAVFLDETKRLADEDDELSEVQPDAVPPEVREWLASTFTRQQATSRRKNAEKPKFRTVAHAIRAGIFVDRIYRRVSSSALMQFPPEVVTVLKHLDDWSFDVFALAEAANGQPVKYLGYDLLNRYGIIHKFKIAPCVLETFLNRIEEGYCRFRNPYHNNLHAADVTQTVHHMLCQTGLMNWMTDLEIFATLLAALIHDYEHTGTTNNFHVMSGSETALLYNDRAVLENHHISAAFRVLKDDECNVLSHLSREEYRELRTLIIDMVLATDMSYHFQQLKNMKNLLTVNDATVDKSKALALVLHCCDISHPAKRWNLHHRWTMLLLEEFFRQGDLERELGLPFSPLCDRNNTLVAESQIGFIDFIVDPSMSVMADLLEHVLGPIAPMCKNASENAEESSVDPKSHSKHARTGRPQCKPICEEEVSQKVVEESQSDLSVSSNLVTAEGKKFRIYKPWIACLTENKKIWKEQAIKDVASTSSDSVVFSDYSYDLPQQQEGRLSALPDSINRRFTQTPLYGSLSYATSIASVPRREQLPARESNRCQIL